eukprot:4380392-Amphidinium_carterae.1
MAAGAAISVHGSVDETEKIRESRPVDTGAAGGVLSPAAPRGESSTMAVASLRTPVNGKRPNSPPGLSGEVEAKARRTEERYYSYNIEQHVVMLQAVVQQFEVMEGVS